MTVVEELFLLVVKVKGHCMTDEVLSARLQLELLVNCFHTVFVQVDA
jgi:hypothetical protein